MRKTELSCSFVLLAALSGVVAARSPELESVDQSGGRPGTDFTVEFMGERLDRVEELLFYQPGLQLARLTAVDDEHLTAVLTAVDDCPLGEHAFRLLGPHGVSRIATLSIGPFPVLDEQEPNDAAADAQPVDLGVTIRGVVEETDVDSYRVTLRRGDRLAAEIEAMRLGGYFFDALLEVVDPQGRVVAQVDDTSLLRQDPAGSILAEQDGNYVLRVREAAFGGDLDSKYRLHIGRFPRPSVAFPAGGRPDERLTFQLLGDARGPLEQVVQLPNSPGELFVMRPSVGGDVAPAPLRLRVVDLPGRMEVEPNEARGEGASLGVPPFAINGRLQKHGDVDWFQFDADEGDQFDVEVYAARLGSPIDSVIRILDSEGREVVRNDDGFVHDSSLRFFAPRSGVYALEVSDHLDRGGTTYVYRVEFSPVAPSLEASIPQGPTFAPQAGQAVVVPRGGRVVLSTSVRRRNFSAPVHVSFADVPPGVVAEPARIPEGKHLGLILFTAAPDAPLGGSLVELQARATVDGIGVVGGLRQEVGLVFGEPRQTVYHAATVDRIPIVVAEEAPFSLYVTPPAAPLAQDGRLSLRVIAQRAPGFDAPIRLNAPLLPPWVERSEDEVVIAANATEGEFVLTSNPETTPGAYPLILIGEAVVEGGDLSLATNRFEVKIAGPHASASIDHAATAQGSSVVVRCKLDWKQPTSGVAVARLLGLPNFATAPEVELTDQTSMIEFPVTVGADTPVSIHNTLYVELTVPEAGGFVTQYLGRGGVLEVFPSGGSARETASRLEQLRGRRKARMASAPANES